MTSMTHRSLPSLLLLLAACSSNVGSRFVKSQDVEASREAVISVSAAESDALAGTQLTIPAGALAQNMRITLELGLDSLAPAANAAGPVAVWGPAGTVFSKPVQMTLPVTLSAAAGTLTVLVREADGRQYELPRSRVTVAGGKITFTTNGFTSFQPAIASAVACTADAFVCPDGTAVGRTGPNCTFACPSLDGGELACPPDVPVCPDGTEVGYNGPNCTVICPDPDAGVVVCTSDAFVCPDGTAVGRSGPNCTFTCPSVDGGPLACPADAFTCPDGTQIGRNGPNCTFVCPSVDAGPTVCTADAFVCPDGTQVGRSGPNCIFVCPGADGGP